MLCVVRSKLLAGVDLPNTLLKDGDDRLKCQSG